MRRTKIWEQVKDKVVKAEISNKLDVVLYFNGKEAEEKKIWTVDTVPVKDGKAKDTIIVPIKVSHNEENTTKTENVKLEIPVEYAIDFVSIGQPQMVRQRVYGEFEKVRIHHIIAGEQVIDPETWEELTDKQKEHLKKIDVWDAYDELITFFESKDRKPSVYANALQQIYNRTKRKEDIKPKYIEVPTHKLVNVNITVKAETPGWNKTYHFTEAGIEHCKNQIIRSVHFELPRVDILKSYLKEVGV